MPKNGTLIEKAQAEHISVREFCERKVKEFGSIFRAAMELKVSPNSIRHHLNKPEDDQPDTDQSKAVCNA